MIPRDTHPVVQRMVDEHHRRMKPEDKGRALLEAIDLARAFQLAGLRVDLPTETETELEERLAERWLGADLYRRACAAREARRGA